MAHLFRAEALANRQRDWLGGIALIRPVSLALLTALVGLATVAVAVFLVVGHYTRKARVTGYLVPDLGVIRLVAPRPAVVLESHAAEGASVRAGDVLFVLSVGQSTVNGDAQAQVQSSLAARQRSLQDAAAQRSQLQQAQLAALDQQIADMTREIASMAGEAELQRQRLALASEAQARLESLRDENFVSEVQVRNKSEEVIGLKAGQQSLARQRAASLRQLAALQAQRRELPLRGEVQQGELDRDMAALNEQAAENEARRRIVVRAPQDGVVTAVMAGPGQSVTSSVALASLLPANARLQAQLFAPSSAVGFVRTHQPVLLRYQAFPYQKFGSQTGEVTQVSRSPLQASELAALQLPGAAPGAEPLYRITVDLARQSVDAYGQAQPLSPGMQLEADVMLDRRRLIEWIFEPVLGLAGRV